MTWRIGDVNPRAMVLATVAGTVIAAAWFLQSQLLPSYDEFQARRELVRSKTTELLRLRRNVASQDQIMSKYAAIGVATQQTETDSATLSGFLRKLEVEARLPSVRIVNITPMPVETDRSAKTYGVRFAVAGKLQEVLMLASALTAGDVGVGINSFSLRGVQGGRRVECSTTVEMVRLTPPGEPEYVCPETRSRMEMD